MITGLPSSSELLLELVDPACDCIQVQMRLNLIFSELTMDILGCGGFLKD